jgi:hypothetical protein
MMEIIWAQADIYVRGQTDLITRPFSQKAQIEIIAANLATDADGALPTTGKKKSAKAKRTINPDEEFELSTYRVLPNTVEAGLISSEFPHGEYAGCPGMVAVAFKRSMVDGLEKAHGLDANLYKTYFHVMGGILPLTYGTMINTTDHSRNAHGGGIILHRPYYHRWGVKLHIIWLASKMSLSYILSFVQAGGMMGVGEHRPSAPKARGGMNGMYVVDQSMPPITYEGDTPWWPIQ